MSLKKKKNCLISLGLWGNQHRKGDVMKEKGGNKWRAAKKTLRGRKKVILKSFGFEGIEVIWV